MTNTAVSAPGKVFLAGGYLVLDRAYKALVFGLSARINVIAETIKTSPGIQLTEIVVESPQFVNAQWSYGYHLADEDGGFHVTQLRVGPTSAANPFVETTLAYALTYVSRLAHLNPSHSITSSRLVVLADNDYYSQPTETTATETKTTTTSGTDASKTGGRFAHFPTTLEAAHKTGLGSSAALVTSLTAALLTHYLPRDLFDVTSDVGRRTLHNLAQAAHCAAQGKVGSGFDVAAAVFGSCTYRRFSPSILTGLPEPGKPGFGSALEALVADRADDKEGNQKRWDVEIGGKETATLPKGLALRMCDVDCGSQTVGMVKQVLAWRAREPEAAKTLWDTLQSRNTALATALREDDKAALPERISQIREGLRQMSQASGVPIEPPSQTELLDALSTIDGVYGGVVPGAGGYDAVALLMDDDEATTKRLEAFVAKWSAEKGARVRLLDVKGEMEGVRLEDASIYKGVDLVDSQYGG